MSGAYAYTQILKKPGPLLQLHSHKNQSGVFSKGRAGRETHVLDGQQSVEEGAAILLDLGERVCVSE